ncbi:MAG: hypothetical protein KF842_00570 [Caulobacter sp.]|nr:hypothetical protein [Caulobacter sp.]
MTDQDDEIEAASALAAFAARYEPDIAGQFLDGVAGLRARMPGADAMIYDNYQGLVVGFGPPTRVSDAVVSILALPRHCTLCFLQGAGLPDPEGLLRGSGSRVRHIRLTGPEMLETPAVAALIDSALDRARVAIPDAPRGRMRVKSISAKQRPRRP